MHIQIHVIPFWANPFYANEAHLRNIKIHWLTQLTLCFQRKDMTLLKQTEFYFKLMFIYVF